MRSEVGLALAAAALVVGSWPALAGAGPRPPAAVRRQLVRVERRVERELRAEARLLGSAGAAEAELRLADRTAADLAQAYAARSLEARRARAQVLRSRLEAARLTVRVAAERASLGRLLREQEEHGPVGLMAVLVGAGSFAAFLSDVGLVGAVMEEQSRLLAATRRSLALRAAALERARAKARVAARAALEARAAKTASQAAARVEARLVTRLVRAVTVARQNIETDARTERRLRAFLARLAAGEPSGSAPTRLAWPVVGPITSPFGIRVDPITHQRALHTGVDIGVPQGTVVHAAAPGSVAYSGWMTGYGNVVVVDDGGAMATLYAHAERLLVTAGQRVTRGQPIALAGMTGWATGPHVHFEVRLHGVPVNPMPYLPPLP